MRYVCSFVVVIFLLANSYVIEGAQVGTSFALCPNNEVIGWGQHQLKFRFNYATYLFVYEDLSYGEWWSEEKPMWALHYEAGLGKRSSFGFDMGGGTIKYLPSQTRQPLKTNGEIWFKIGWKKERLLPAGAVVVYVLPRFPLVVIDALSSYAKSFFSFIVGVRCHPVGNNGAIIFPVPASFFLGISLRYKKLDLIAEYSGRNENLLIPQFGESSMLVSGINFNFTPRIVLGLKYVNIYYDDQEVRNRENIRTYSERWGVDLTLSFGENNK